MLINASCGDKKKAPTLPAEANRFRKKFLTLAGHYVSSARPLFAFSYLKLDRLPFVE